MAKSVAGDIKMRHNFIEDLMSKRVFFVVSNRGSCLFSLMSTVGIVMQVGVWRKTNLGDICNKRIGVDSDLNGIIIGDVRSMQTLGTKNEGEREGNQLGNHRSDVLRR